jgi:hypothetical protein
VQCYNELAIPRVRAANSVQKCPSVLPRRLRIKRLFAAERVKHTGPAPASEHFGRFGTAGQAPSVFWFAGGNDPQSCAEAKAAGKLNTLCPVDLPLFLYRGSGAPCSRTKQSTSI